MTGVNDASSTAAGVGTVSSANYTVDTHVPTATVTLSDSALIAGDTTTVTFTFGEPVTNFTLADVTAPNGTFGALSAPITNGDGTQSYTATFTPDRKSVVKGKSVDLGGRRII